VPSSARSRVVNQARAMQDSSCGQDSLGALGHVREAAGTFASGLKVGGSNTLAKKLL